MARVVASQMNSVSVDWHSPRLVRTKAPMIITKVNFKIRQQHPRPDQTKGSDQSNQRVVY